MRVTRALYSVRLCATADTVARSLVIDAAIRRSGEMTRCTGERFGAARSDAVCVSIERAQQTG